MKKRKKEKKKKLKNIIYEANLFEFFNRNFLHKINDAFLKFLFARKNF
jgi:hypothetical protein